MVLILLGCNTPNRPPSIHQLTLTHLAEELDVPAIAAFIKTRDTTWYFTVGHDASGQNISTHTLFEAASLSKPLFAASIHATINNLDSVIQLPTNQEAYALVRTATAQSFDDLYGTKTTIRQLLSHSIGDSFLYRETGYLALQALDVAPLLTSSEGSNWAYAWEELDTSSWVNGYITGKRFERPIRMPQTAFCNGTLTTGIEGLCQSYEHFVEPQLPLWTQNTHHVTSNIYWASGIGLEVSQDTFAWHYGSNYCYNAFWIKNLNTGRTVGILTNSVSGRRLIARWIPEAMQTKLNALEWIEWYP